MPGQEIENSVNTEAKNSENPMEQNLNKVKKEVDELKEADRNINVVEGLSGLLTSEFGDYLKTQPDVLNSLFESCKDYKNKNPDVKDTWFDNLYMFLNEARKECAEIEASNIKVTLRWERWRNLEGEELNPEKQRIAKELNDYVEMRDVLPAEIQELLMLTKAALEAESQIIDKNGKQEPYSDEVVALEQKLVSLWAMNETADPGKNNGVDWKFWNQTYDALMSHIDKSLKESAEIKDIEDIKVKLRWNIGQTKREENKEKYGTGTVDGINYSYDSYEKFSKNWKSEAMQQINDIIKNWGALSPEDKKVLLLLSSALKHVSDGNDTSPEVKELENELNHMGLMPKEWINGENNGVDWKFGHHTWNAVVAYFKKDEENMVK